MGGGIGDSSGGEGNGGGGVGGGIGDSVATKIRGIHCGGQAPPLKEASSERPASDSSRSPSAESCVWAAQKTVATPRRTMVQLEVCVVLACDISSDLVPCVKRK